MENTQTPFHLDHSSLITYMQHPMHNPGDISNPTTAFNMALALMAKAFTLNDTTPTNNNQRSSSNPSSMQICTKGYEYGPRQDNANVKIMLETSLENAMHMWNQVVLNASQNPGVQNVGIQNGLSVVSEIANQHGDGNVVTAPPAEGNSNGINENRIRCYNCRGEDHYASNCTVKPRKLDAAYLQKQMQIAQKEEAGIQLTSEEFDFMAAAGACEETERANANCSLENNLQQASSSGTQSDEAPVYDSDGSAEVHHSENCYDNDIFNMFTQEEQYTELLEPIPEPHQVQQNNSNVISEVSSVEQSGGIVDQHPANVEETRAYFESLYNNLATEVEKVNLVNRKMKETNAELTTELASMILLLLHDSEETLQLAQESRQKMKQLNKEIKPANYTKINLLSGIFVSQTAKSQEEVYFVNTSKTATVSKSISKPNEEFLDDTTLSVAQILTEVKKAAKFVRDFKSLAKEADESLAKHKTLKLEIERLLRAVVSQDIMSIVQNPSVVDSSNLQTELDRTKDRLENCIIKKENEYAKLWNDWYKKCEECKYDKISYDKAYNDMQQKIERLQAQLGDLKGKSCDTQCASNTLDPLSQKLENENVELEFQVRNYEKEIAHLKTTYKNLFDSISVTRAQTKTIIDSLQNKLQDTIYENAKLRAQLFDKVSEQVDTTKGTSTNTKFANQSTERKPSLQPVRKNLVVRQPNAFQSKHTTSSKNQVPQKVDETNDLSKPVTSNSVPTPQESKIVKHDNVIAPGMFRINPFKPSREEKYVPIKVRASVRTKPIIVSQSHVITKNDVNSKTNGFSPKDSRSTTRTRRPKPWNNPKSDKVHFKSKSGCLSNKLEKIEENHRSLQSSHYPNRTSSECNNIKLAIRNEKSEVICATCKQCLITANHDDCVLQYVNGMKSRKKNQSANVSKSANQKKHKAQVWKPKNVGSKERFASPKPSKLRSCLRWSPTGRFFDLKGKIITSSESESQSDCSKGDNACTSNPQEPIRKRFPSSTFSMTGCQNWFDTLLIPLLSEYKSKDKASYGDNECDT
ncbi:retrovirus-related pol polyprotein from transposon TNT 1-94 [Tanacetum coccineum]